MATSSLAGPVAIRWGDTWTSEWQAILGAGGTPFSLAGWTVLAQLRKKGDPAEALFTWTVGAGITVGTAQVRLASGAQVATAAVQLRLTPADFLALPRKWKGLLEVEIASDATDHPAQSHTIVPADPSMPGIGFVIFPDVAHV